MLESVELPIRPHRSKFSVTLHKPHPDSECPILQESISDAVLDWMPRPYNATVTENTAITTPCNHTFHAMALVYHWARNKNLLCPVCRHGPKNAHLVLSRLPKEWKYSMAARVRRERKRDKEEKEEHDRAVARSFVEPTMPSMLFSFKIRLESNLNSVWLLNTIPVAIMDYVIFDVPDMELSAIPFDPTSKIRMLSLLYTSTGVTTLYPPSNWFQAGEEPGNSFSVHWDERGFHHIHFRMQDQQFSQMVQFALLA
jgi:hypothetical protein